MRFDYKQYFTDFILHLNFDVLSDYFDLTKNLVGDSSKVVDMVF